MDVLDSKDPLIVLADTIKWEIFEADFKKYYSKNGRPAKPIRLMVGLLLLKQLENLSDENIVLQFKRNPYYQYFCGFSDYQPALPCCATDLVYFRNRIGKEGIQKIFSMSVSLHGESAKEKQVIVDTTVQENNITYPTDGKLAIKIINHLIKIAKRENIKLRRSYVKEIKQLRILLRFFKHPRKIKKAKGAMKRLRTIAKTILRDIDRKFGNDMKLHQKYAKDFYLYMRVLLQEKTTKNKIYSLHETHAYAINKGKDHKGYEFGTKASIVTTKDSGIIVGVTAHCKNEHDSKTLDKALNNASSNTKVPIYEAICDRGYKGVKEVMINLKNKNFLSLISQVKFSIHKPAFNLLYLNALNNYTIKHTIKISIPATVLKRDTKKQLEIKREKFRRRASIEPVIGHLKSDYRLGRNYLKGFIGDEINLLLAACAFNLKKWMRIYFFALFSKDLALLSQTLKRIQAILLIYEQLLKLKSML